MAKLERTIHGNFDEVLERIVNGIMNGEEAFLDALRDVLAWYE